MRWSVEEPEWRPVCECRYDEIRDEVFRGDCELHYDMIEESEPDSLTPTERKPPASVDGMPESQGTGKRSA